jgi:hypothetical protein
LGEAVEKEPAGNAKLVPVDFQASVGEAGVVPEPAMARG